MENTGLLQDPRTDEEKKLDYNFVSLMGDLDTTIDWDPYLPDGRKQAKYNPDGTKVFDSNSCVSYACNTSLMTRFNYDYQHSMSEEKKKFLLDNGYIVNGKVVFSDRFLAIMSDTTIGGNYAQKVLDTARKFGLIPASMLVFGGNTWNEYMDKSVITSEMKAQGLKFAELFDIQYGWLYTDNHPNFTENEKIPVKSALKYCPVVIGVPIPSGHCICMYKENGDNPPDNFDHYIPFKRIADSRPIAFFVGVRVFEKVPQVRTLMKGMKGEDVKELQRKLKKLGFFTFPSITGNYGIITVKAVKDFQLKHGIVQTGNFGPITRAKLDKVYV